LKPTIILVHGAFCGGWAFDAFRRPFEAQGYRCITPDLPGHSDGARQSDVVNLSMSDYAAAIAAIAAEQESPPILLGHSLGGLVAQMAATRCKLAALILLAPSAPWGVAGASLEEAASAFGLYALGPFWAQAVAPDRAVARLYSLDRMTKAGGHLVVDKMTAESGRALFETLNWWLDPFMTTQVDFSRVQAPVFVGCGGSDLIHPPSTVRQTAHRLHADLRVFDQMSHWLIGEEGWETVSGACLDWLGATIPRAQGARTPVARKGLNRMES
jgi:pimeloyl-ACP methyl ester carboxylesterase